MLSYVLLHAFQVREAYIQSHKLKSRTQTACSSCFTPVADQLKLITKSIKKDGEMYI